MTIRFILNAFLFICLSSLRVADTSSVKLQAVESAFGVTFRISNISCMTFDMVINFSPFFLISCCRKNGYQQDMGVMPVIPATRHVGAEAELSLEPQVRDLPHGEQDREALTIVPGTDTMKLIQCLSHSM